MKHTPTTTRMTEDEMMPLERHLSDKFTRIANGETDGLIVLSTDEYRNLVISHNKLYEYIFLSNPDLLVTKRMQAAGEIYDQTKTMR